jgi:hypothetical protein
VGFSLAFGAVLYPVYRGLFYNWLMPRLQDKTRWKSDSYRTYLKRQFGVKRKCDANRLYVAMRDHQLQDAHSAADATIANVHLGYMTTLILLFFSAASVITGCNAVASRLFIISAVIFLGTFFFERRFQSDEHDRFLARCKPLDISVMAVKLGIIEKDAGHDRTTTSANLPVLK